MIALFVLAPLALSAELLRAEIKLDQQALPKQKVEVIAFQNDKKVFEKAAQTDVTGSARFDLDTKAEYNLVIRTLYFNVPYFSEVLFSKALPKTPVKLNVYKTEASDPRVKISDLRLFVSAAKDSLRVEEEILIDNQSPFTIVGTGSGQNQETFRVTLPAGTHDLMFGDGFEENETRFDGNDMVVSRPLLPGFTRFSMKYDLERSLSSAEMNRKFSLPVQTMSLASDIDGLRWKGINAREQGKKFFGGKMFPTYTADLSGKQEFKVAVSGLPLKYRYSQVFPFFVVLLLLLIMLPFMKKVPPEIPETEREKDLKQLVLIKRLRDRALIDDLEFQKRRLEIYERLLPFYETKAS